uniref:Ig-like domain-containing protein n=1 Tax=Bos indicus x Bos taurus TaxID=30522 RepID=A0A4W2DUN0_BOBOX
MLPRFRVIKLHPSVPWSSHPRLGPSHLMLCVSCPRSFRVTGPLDPIVAVLGGEAVLPCSLFPAVSAEDMELRWFRSKSLETVFAYQNRQEQKEEQMTPYAGRTSLVGNRLNQGYAAVRIQRVQASDNGLYTCFFRKGHFYEEAGLELKVAGVGSAPQVRITGPEEDGVRVVCTASGWFPKPQVQWRDLSGEKFLAFSEAHTQDAEGLFSVEAALLVRDSSVGNVTCSILNPVLGREKAMAIFIPEEFTVIAPPDPIVAVLGGEVLLPCRVSPAMSAEDMELRWFRSKFSEAVFIYQDRLEQKEEQMAPYAGRTSLVRDLLIQGEAAVRIQNVNVSDNGLYTCFFRKGGFYEEASLELKVAGVGSAPQVRITGPEEDGVRVVCTASGWFPKPQVQWRDLSGEKFLAFSEAHTQDAEGLFSVEAALVVRDSSVGNVTCSILNPVLGQEKAMAIFIPGQRCSRIPAGLEEGPGVPGCSGLCCPGQEP